MKFITPVLILLVFIALVILIVRLEKYYKEFKPIIDRVESFKIPNIFS